MTTIIKRTPITMDGKYKTASGDNVRILCVDAGGEYPVVGLVEGAEGADCWTRDGLYTAAGQGGSGYDLVAVPETRTVWVNVYTGGNARHFVSENNAKF